MTVFTVRHVTTYRYRRRVRLGQHQLLVRPRDSFDQRLLSFDLTIRPQPSRLRWVHDVFGNCITYADFDAEADTLQFACSMTLDHTPENLPEFTIEDYARDHPFSYRDNELPDLLPFLQRSFADPDGTLEMWLDTFLMHSSRQPTGHVLMTLNEAIAESFRYRRRTMPGVQSPAQTIELMEGTCRDFAVLMIEAARALGFAARFVTGYIYVPDRDGSSWLGGGSTHAWAQVYLPGAGWVEFDPTNGIVGNRDLIRVGVARMPDQAIPLFGTYWGEAGDQTDMAVEVNVKTAADQPDIG
jgi:transglutaminase-like putative cysteine protease